MRCRRLHYLLPCHGRSIRLLPTSRSLLADDGEQEVGRAAGSVGVDEGMEAVGDGDVGGQEAIELEGEEELVDLAQTGPAHGGDARSEAAATPVEHVRVADLQDGAAPADVGDALVLLPQLGDV
eukprot:225279-Hanusia_phi.AAC.2